MARTSSKLAALVAMVTLSLTGACGPGQEEKQAAARAEELGALSEAKAALDAKRQEVADLEQELAELDAAGEEGEEEGAGEGGEAGAAEGGEEGVGVSVEDRRAELESTIAQKRQEIATEADELTSAIVDFINADPPIEGEPLSETQQAAIRLKSSEDLYVAREHIEKGGDYRRATDIYRQALLIDPDNPELQAALEKAEADRYMTEERFSRVRKGMNEAEVRDVLGTPFYRNIREYPDRGVVAWFYPTGEGGGASAVWFRVAEEDRLEVYDQKFDAVGQEEPAE